MARNSLKSPGKKKSANVLPSPKILLTLKQGLNGQVCVDVSVAECIAYAQNTGFTRLNLTGGKVLEVKESTDQIDRLVRAASSQPNPVNRSAVSAADQSFNVHPGQDLESSSQVDKTPEFPALAMDFEPGRQADIRKQA